METRLYFFLYSSIKDDSLKSDRFGMETQLLLRLVSIYTYSQPKIRPIRDGSLLAFIILAFIFIFST